VITSDTLDGTPILIIDRPGRRNTLVPELAEALVANLRGAGEARRPIVLTAAGTAFCLGADLKWLGTCPDPAEGVAELVAMHHLAITTLLEMPVPVIVAINGPVAGGGLGLALAGDYRVAAQSATFTAAYFRLGLTPDGGSSAFLQELVGRARTLELLLTNRSLTAAEALDWGLVNEVVADDVLVQRAVAFANSLQAVPAWTMRQTRGLLDAINFRNQLQLESVAIRTAARGDFFRDALKAFVDAHPG
jgi:2-(1,2-epoxy-1,2-dihydrophenyl)acetyl-CoA isomerase